MNEQTGENYSFCPQCGTLMENGICPECAKKNASIGVYSAEHYPQQPQDRNPQNIYQGQSNAYRQNAYQGQPNAYQQNTYQGQPNAYRQNAYQGQQYTYQQNGFYGQNNGNSQYSPYMQPKKDNKVWVIIGIITAVVILLGTIVGSFFYGYFLMKFSEDGAEIFAEEFGMEENFADDDAEGFERGSDEEDYGYEAEEDYTPSPDDEYYYGPCDSINTDVPYSFINKTYTNEDLENDIDIQVLITNLESVGVDTPEDLVRAEAKLAEKLKNI